MRRARLRALLTGAVLVGGTLAVPVAAPAGPGAEELLPDMQTRRQLAEDDLYIQKTQGKRLLRFANEVMNVGRGPLEVRPVARECIPGTGSTTQEAWQVIYADSDGDGIFDRSRDSEARTKFVGCLIDDDAHNHWHLANVARYRLKRFRSDGTLKREPVRASDKVTFCLLDNYLRKELAGAPRDPYYPVGQSEGRNCTRRSTMGISVGWGDKYAANLPGQAIDITGLARGAYCLVSKADPANKLVEIHDHDNNVSRRRISIDGTKVSGLRYRGC